LATLREEATIDIGDGCGFSGSSICAAKSIIIGDHSGFGANASAYDTDFHSATHFGTNLDGISKAASKPIKVGTYVWVGANALILKGVHIEDHCIVPAGTIVRTNLTANSTQQN
jgi:acetyltransferase-like isoleucine patch superfamily enzyme